jgi:uncharacterized coiled-coil protein SlyX
MKARLEELGSGTCFEAIERLLLQISEKDKVINGLNQTVHDMRSEVMKINQNAGNQEGLIELQN